MRKYGIYLHLPILPSIDYLEYKTGLGFPQQSPNAILNFRSQWNSRQTLKQKIYNTT